MMIRNIWIGSIIRELPKARLEKDMEPICIEHGDLHKQELIALELEIRKEILDFIGFEQKKIKDIGEKLGLNNNELKAHLFLLERAMLVEQDEGCCRLTPRCIAYLDTKRSYEWRR
jgi:predicted Rossmann fold nucleotide-binding protein DprA/Smf involved in DNA uptake